MPLNRTIAVIALATIAVIGVMIGPPAFTNSVVVPRGLGTPILAMELARDVAEIDLILGPKPSADRITMRLKTLQDFAFITGYGSLFVLLSLILRKTDRLWGTAALALSIAAPLLDIVENVQILRICDTPLALTAQSTIDWMRYASYGKWACAFLATGLLTRVYFAMGKRLLPKIFGWMYVAVAVTGIAGLVVHPVLFNYAMMPLPIGLAGTAWLFWWNVPSKAHMGNGSRVI